MTEHFYSSLINYVRLINEVLDTIQEGFFVLNYEGQILKTNKSFQQLVGLAEEKMLGNCFKETIVDLPTIIIEMLKDAMEQKTIQENDFFWTSKDKWFHFFIYPFAEGLTGIFLDITEGKIQEEKVKKSEYLLKAILNSTSDTNILVDTKGEILSFNRAAAENMKSLYQKEIQVGQNMIAEYGLPNTKEIFVKDFLTALSGREVATERLLTFPNNEQVWVNLRLFPVFNEKGEVWAVSLNYTNIDRLKRQHAKLEEIARLQSHTIRRPLTSILGLIDILNKNCLSEENQKIVEYLKQSALELDMVIHQIVKNTAE
jgi:PAS domain S-box-containing protein